MRSFKNTFILKEEENTASLNGFCLLKPEFMEYEDEFLTLLKNNGWDVIQKVKKKLSLEDAKELYKMHKSKKFYDELCTYMASSECLACVCHKDCKDPIKDMNSLKDKVRKAWGKSEMKNGMHSSDSLENVNREYKLIFENKVIEGLENSIPVEVVGYDIPADQSELLNSETFKVNLSKKINELQLGYTVDQFIECIYHLKIALSEEFNAWYSYMIIIPYLEGIHRDMVSEFFKETAKDELEDHAYWLMERLNQFGVAAEEHIASTNWDNIAVHKYIPMQKDTLCAVNCAIQAELGAIETYKSIEVFTRDIDPVTNTKIKEILADEQEHLSELYDLQKDLNL